MKLIEFYTLSCTLNHSLSIDCKFYCFYFYEAETNKFLLYGKFNDFRNAVS